MWPGCLLRSISAETSFFLRSCSFDSHICASSRQLVGQHCATARGAARDFRSGSPGPAQVYKLQTSHYARHPHLLLITHTTYVLAAGSSSGSIARLHEALNEISAAAAQDPRTFTGFTKRWKPQSVFADDHTMHQGAADLRSRALCGTVLALAVA